MELGAGIGPKVDIVDGPSLYKLVGGTPFGDLMKNWNITKIQKNKNK